MKGDLVPVEGCTRCWCGCKYWDFNAYRNPGLSEWFCHSCEEPFRTWQYALDSEGIPQTKDAVELDNHHRVW